MSCTRGITGEDVPFKAVGLIKPDASLATLVVMHEGCDNCEGVLDQLRAKGWDQCGPVHQLGEFKDKEEIDIAYDGGRSTMKIRFVLFPGRFEFRTSSKTSWSVEIDGDTFHFERPEPNPAPQRLQVSREELERLRELAVEKQKEGAAPLPVVRLCFVGRGRAGKTTTLRRLKGEPFRDEEPSTHGLDVWAGQAEAHLQADGSAAGPWKEWKESVHHTAVKDALRKAPEECWPEMLQQLGEALEERQPEVQMRCSGEDKNQEAILFHSDHVYFRERIHFHRAFRENSKKVVTEAHFQHAGMGLLRVVTTHLPGAPFGRARKEFADCIAGIVKGEKLPTVLLADLNFPEKAIQPLLLDHDLDVSFVPTPYPTNICQGSLLPKRIDSIAVINHEVKGAKLQATALKAEDVLDGLREVVDLLKSRSAEPWTPTRYQSDKDPSGRWSIDFTYTIGPEGNEGIFDGKVQLLDRHVYNSVSAAVNNLNDGLFVVPEGYCVVFSGSKHNYYLLWREDKKAEVFSLLGLSDQSAEPLTPTRHQSDKDPSPGPPPEPEKPPGRWSIDFAYTIGPEGNEGIFDGKVQLLDRRVYNSVSAAVNYLNDGLSVVPEGYCVVFSGSQQNYYLLWREDKKAEVFSLLGLSDQ